MPVSDLATSAGWYRDLLDLEYVREFSEGESVTGCALADFSVRYLVTSGHHADGAWTEFLDHDRIALRILHDAAGPHSFLGVRFAENGEQMFYETALLQLPPRPTPDS